MTMYFKDGRDENGVLIATDGEPLKNNDDLHEIKLPLHITKPTVLYIGGRGQKEGDPTSLSKAINFVKDTLRDELSELPDIFTWAHADKYDEKGFKGNVASLAHIWACTHIPGYSSAAGKELAAGVIMPLVTNEQGKALPYDEARDNLRKLVLFSYCLGSTTAQEMKNAARKMMKQAGYSRADRDQLLEEIVLKSFANLQPSKKMKKGFNTVYSVHSDDFFILMQNVVVRPFASAKRLVKNLAQTLTGNLTSLLASSSERLTVKEMSRNCVEVSAAARANMITSLMRIKRRIDGVKLGRWKAVNNHDARGYVSKAVNLEQETNQMANMASNVLVNALSDGRKNVIIVDGVEKAVLAPRTSKPTALNLLTGRHDLPEDIPQETEYNIRLARGLERGQKTFLDNLTGIFHKKAKVKMDESTITITSYQYPAKAQRPQGLGV